MTFNYLDTNNDHHICSKTLNQIFLRQGKRIPKAQVKEMFEQSGIDADQGMDYQ